MSNMGDPPVGNTMVPFSPWWQPWPHDGPTYTISNVTTDSFVGAKLLAALDRIGEALEALVENPEDDDAELDSDEDDDAELDSDDDDDPLWLDCGCCTCCGCACPDDCGDDLDDEPFAADDQA